MKTLRKEVLKNGITVELVEYDGNYQVITSVTNYPETITFLDKAILTFEKRIKLYSRFSKFVIN
ncbi:hypothetical protein [Lysinibacillus sp. BPa_S21]|uniref:hypothetical protein n=1 Tax=Lysinibacillus sp. BPa_S21 TaxID=2932478 RepID=UPI00201247DC|nr:hypothetical protein [Lysinibacillus sp. BPa_S21]MCL1696294.1 hypothetical protein [Lysinibacillus sp. BPa_S21]